MITKLFRDWVTGQLKVERLLNTQRAALYAGANPGSKRPHPHRLHSEEGHKYNRERIFMIRCAREMEEDMPLAEAVLSDFETYTVGACIYRADTGNKDADRVINKHLEWRFDQVDYTQRFDLAKLSRLTVRGSKRDGQVAWIPTHYGDDIKVNLVSGDRIGDPLLGGSSQENNYGGIIIDEFTGAPLRYQIFKKLQKTEQYKLQLEVLADDVFHYYDPFRIEGYHGVTAFRCGIEYAFDVKQAIDLALQNMKFRSAQLPAIRNQEGKDRTRRNTYGDGGPSDPNAGEPKQFEIMIGGAKQSFLRLGEDFVDFPNDFPNQQFQPMLDALNRAFCVGCKLPIEFVYQSQSGGVVQRFYADKARNTFSEDKRWLRRVCLDPLKNRILQNDIEKGILDLSTFGELADLINENKLTGKWHLGREISVDYSREVDADLKLIDAGVSDPDDYIEYLGGDPEYVRSKLKENAERVLSDAEEIAKRRGLSIEVVLPLLQKKFQNPFPPGSSEPVQPDPQTPVNPVQ